MVGLPESASAGILARQIAAICSPVGLILASNSYDGTGTVAGAGAVAVVEAGAGAVAEATAVGLFGAACDATGVARTRAIAGKVENLI